LESAAKIEDAFMQPKRGDAIDDMRHSVLHQRNEIGIAWSWADPVAVSELA
jgi:hypothetical protein